MSDDVHHIGMQILQTPLSFSFSVHKSKTNLSGQHVIESSQLSSKSAHTSRFRHHQEFVANILQGEYELYLDRSRTNIYTMVTSNAPLSDSNDHAEDAFATQSRTFAVTDLQ